MTKEFSRYYLIYYGIYNIKKRNKCIRSRMILIHSVETIYTMYTVEPGAPHLKGPGPIDSHFLSVSIWEVLDKQWRLIL